MFSHANKSLPFENLQVSFFNVINVIDLDANYKSFPGLTVKVKGKVVEHSSTWLLKKIISQLKSSDLGIAC